MVGGEGCWSRGINLPFVDGCKYLAKLKAKAAAADEDEDERVRNPFSV